MPSHIPPLPPGYDSRTAYALTSRNVIVATHPTLPPLYLDECLMAWCEVDRPIAEVHHALASSKC